MRIGGFLKHSVIDYPGKVAAVIFTQGCNFRCPYCHNPAMVMPDKFSPAWDNTEVLHFLLRRAKYLEGVVITGGEPTVQKDLVGFITAIKSLGFSVKLDTNGSCPDVLRKLISRSLVDYIAMDVKAPAVHYAQAAGCCVDTNALTESIALIRSSGIRHMFRTTLIRQWHGIGEIKAIHQWTANDADYMLQPFIPRNSMVRSCFTDISPYTDKDVQELNQALFA